MPISLIHSWVCEGPSFRFFCTDSISNIYDISLRTSQSGEVLQAVQKLVSGLLQERRELALPHSEVAEVKERLQNSDDKLRILRDGIEGRFISSDQAFELMTTFTDAFDKMDAIVFLNTCLVDQARFWKVLEVLEDERDRQNVWHRMFCKVY